MENREEKKYKIKDKKDKKDKQSLSSISGCEIKSEIISLGWERFCSYCGHIKTFILSSPNPKKLKRRSKKKKAEDEQTEETEKEKDNNENEKNHNPLDILIDICQKCGYRSKLDLNKCYVL